ncbi:flavin reductase family protein [Streptomyces sp. NPDC057654]|uniref:flavin reductase family protein n=1 Tax=Streptomyces sp. NPDC057654 TaxID=3346196 RepID=UPI0036B76368
MADPMADATAPSVISAAQFRSLMTTFPSGVTVVTSSQEGRPPRGATCSSLSSVATEPATLLVCLKQTSHTLAAILGSAAFAVNLLHDQAEHTAALFASSVPDRFARVRWTDEPSFGGPHLVDDAHTVADCHVARTVPVGDHTVVFGEVFRVSTPTGRSSDPLLYALRSYWSMNQGEAAIRPVDATLR